MCLCVEFLFDLCHGLRLIMSADRWFEVYLVLGIFFAPFSGVFFQPVVVNLALIEHSYLCCLYIRVCINTYLLKHDICVNVLHLDDQMSFCV